MPIPMIVKKVCRPHGSGTPQLNPGDSYDAPTSQKAALAQAIGWADYVPEEEDGPDESMFDAEGQLVNKPAKKAVKKAAGKYNTRQMRAR